MRPREVEVPDPLWTHSDLNEGAKLLWCYLRAFEPERQNWTYHDLRQAIGVSQNSLLQYLGELQERGWLRWTQTGLRTIAFETLWKEGKRALRLPSDLLTDSRLGYPARWIWGVIRRGGGPFTYEVLGAQTGYCYHSLSRYVGQLTATGWLVGRVGWEDRRRVLHLQPVNPHELKRQAELAELSQVLELARNQEGYSLGQCIMARMVRLLTDSIAVENAEVTGLDNNETGGRMHYDLFLPEHKLALEFHGPQHDGTTERFSDPGEVRAQRRRDLLKLGLSQEQGIELLVVRAKDLRLDRMRQLLAGRVPLKKDTELPWHLREELERVAARYRRSAERHRRPALSNGAPAAIGG